MTVWFVRSNGETLHNDPRSPLYVHGEPPEFPDRAFDSRDACLHEGFVRVGWPATGDLDLPDWSERALDAYAPHMESHHRRYLEQFSTIETGDIVLMPSGLGQFSVHIGAVILRDPATRHVRTVRPRLHAYSYQYDVSRGDRFENAHRVDVLWDADIVGNPAIYTITSLGGLWRRGFTPVGKAADDVVRLARKVGLPIAR